MNKDKILVAQIGRSVGLKGYLKLNIFSDFPEQFKKNRVLDTTRGPLEIEDFDPKRNLIKFKGYDSLESAKVLTNAKIYSSKDESKKWCNLKEGEYFWFDIEGCDLIEDNNILGKVEEIRRMGGVDYLFVKSSDSIKNEGLPSSFLVPYIDRYIKDVDIENKKIYVEDVKDIIRAS